MGRLFLVGTPIGNLEDLSQRAKRILQTVTLVACEDTRVTRKLLSHYHLTTPVISLHQHSRPDDLGGVLDRVAAGQPVAVVTDAGMPGIADPGGRLVAGARERGIPVEVVPGPSALTAALALSGFPADRFWFVGFLPHKKGRPTLLRRIAATEETVVVYESPHRLMKTLEALATMMPNRRIAVCRELTKIHESVVSGTAAEAHQHFQHHPDEVRGEIVLVVGPRS
ncbi:MAG: 16S rRNA (cytidine(1402)-2'-O)-methyltransferase [Candidatus Kerfeldbacteria bacterium]|nr:16S rRNA (cytidine(1402)-2'-O)-methyltransferase [Candidatus Kerfeldbacteria bacterium]